MAKTLTVAGTRYEVVEDLGYVPMVDQYAKVILKEGSEVMVVRDVGTRSWVFYKTLAKPLHPKQNVTF